MSKQSGNFSPETTGSGPDPGADQLREQRLEAAGLAGLERFRILDPIVDPEAAQVRLRYALDERVKFEEIVTLPVPGAPLPAALVRLLAIAAGTSYYKTAAPAEVRIELGPISPEELRVAEHLYDQGLREFAVGEGLPVPLGTRISADVAPSAGTGAADTPGILGDSASAVSRPSEHLDPARALVPIGGGKDSAVVMSVFPEAIPFAVGPPGPSRRVAEVVGSELQVATRRLSPNLRDLNEAGALNGHIPVTAITSSIALLAAAQLGATSVLMGNERSASEPTRWVNGHPVNHQYSKSFEFELIFAAAADVCSGGQIAYFSILRPFSELAIARGLVEDESMLDAFLSCNEAFTIWRATDQREHQTWCRNCPKCRFVALMIGPFMSPKRLEAVMGGNLLADPNQIEGVAALWDLASKPFECVGEMVESALALEQLAADEGWQSCAVPDALADSARAFVREQGGDFSALLRPIDAHRVPEPFFARMRDRLAPELRTSAAERTGL